MSEFIYKKENKMTLKVGDVKYPFHVHTHSSHYAPIYLSDASPALPQNAKQFNKWIKNDRYYKSLIQYLSNLNEQYLTKAVPSSTTAARNQQNGSNNILIKDSGGIQPADVSIDKLSKICLDYLQESSIHSEEDRQHALNVLIHSVVLDLNIKIASDNPKTQQKAKNEKLILQHSLEQAQKGLTKTINIAGHDIPYSSHEKETFMSCFLRLFGNAGSSAGFVQTCDTLQTNVAIDASVLLFPAIAAFSASFVKLYNNLTTALNLLKGKTTNSDNVNSKGVDTQKTPAITVEQVQKKIENLFDDLINNVATTEFQQSYSQLLTDVSDMTNEDIKKLTTVVSKVKIPQPGIIFKSYSCRNTLPGLLHLLDTSINEQNDNSTSPNTNQAVLNQIYQKCYSAANPANPNITDLPQLPVNERQQFTYKNAKEYLGNLINNTNWDDRIATYNSLNKARFVVEHTQESDKKLLIEYFINQTQVIEDKLNLHRRNFDWKAITLTSIGIFISNIATIILPLGVEDVNWLVSGGLLVAGTQSVGTGTFNAICGASTFGEPLRSTSVHGNSTKKTLKEIDKAATSKKNEDQPLESIQDQEQPPPLLQPQPLRAMKELVDDILSPSPQQLTIDDIKNKVDNFCNSHIDHISENDKAVLITTILEYNIKTSGSYKGKSIPLIYELYDKAGDEEKQKILEYYYTNALNVTTAPQNDENPSNNKLNDFEQLSSKFSDYLTNRSSNLSEATLNLCKCLATIAHCETIHENNDMHKAKIRAMATELSRALGNAKADKNSNFNKLTQANHLRNFMLRFISGTVAYALSVTLASLMSGLTFGVGAIPAAGVVLVIFTLKRLFDRTFAESHSTQKLDDSVKFLNQFVTGPTTNSNNPTADANSSTKVNYWEAVELNEDNSVLFEKLNFSKDLGMILNPVTQQDNNFDIHVYTLNLIEQISKLSYDTQSLLSLLQYVTKKISEDARMGVTDKRVVFTLLSLAIESPKFKDVLNDIRTDYMYQTLVGLVTALSWATYIAPIIRTSYTLSIAFIRVADLIVGSGIGFVEGIFTAPNCRKMFYEIIGTEEKAYKEAKNILNTFNESLNNQGDVQPVPAQIPQPSGHHRQWWR